MSSTLYTPTHEDAEELAQFGAATYRDTWQPLYTKEVMDNYLTTAFAPQTIAAYLRHPQHRYWVVRAGGSIIAYAKSGPLSLPIEAADDCIELQRLYVLPTHQRKGLARQLLAAFEDHARTQRIPAAFLSVWSSNAPALALYRAAGFYEVGQFYMPLGDFTNYDIAPDLILKKDYA